MVDRLLTPEEIEELLQQDRAAVDNTPIVTELQSPDTEAGFNNALEFASGIDRPEDQNLTNSPIINPTDINTAGETLFGGLANTFGVRQLLNLPSALGNTNQALENAFGEAEVPAELRTPQEDLPEVGGTGSFFGDLERSFLEDEEGNSLVARGDEGFAVTGRFLGEAATIAGSLVKLLPQAARFVAGRVLGTSVRKLTANEAADVLKENIAARVATKVGVSPDAGKATKALIGARNLSSSAGTGLRNIPDALMVTTIQSPGRFLALEAGAAGGGVLGGTTATTLAQDQGVEDTSLAGAIGSGVGSIFNLTNAAQAIFGKKVTEGSIRNLWQKLKLEKSGDADKIRAAEVIRNAADTMKVDVEELLGKLDSRLLTLREAGSTQAGNLPPSAVLGDDFLGTLREFSGETLPANTAKLLKDKGVRGIGQFQEGALSLADELADSADPVLAGLAVQLRRQTAKDLGNNIIAESRGELFRSVLELRPTQAQSTVDPLAASAELSRIRAQSSKNVQNILEEAFFEANKLEDILYSTFAGEREIANQSFIGLEDTLVQIQRTLGEGSAQNIPFLKDIQGFVSNGGTVAAVRRTRTRMLQEARRMRQPNVNQLDQASDLSKFADELQDVIDTENFPGLEFARQFAAEKRALFTRGFAGRVLGTDKQGAELIDPETILDMAAKFSRNQEPLRLDDLALAARQGDAAAGLGGNRQEAVGALRAQRNFNEFADEPVTFGTFMEAAFGFDTPLGSRIMSEADVFLRATMADFVDPQSGEFLPREFAKFVRNNNTLLDRPAFAELKADVSTLSGAINNFDRVTKQVETISKDIARRKAFGSSIAVDNPVPVMEQVIRQGTQPKEFNAFVSSARKAQKKFDLGGDGVNGAIEGLRSASLLAARQLATSDNGFNWRRYQSLLFNKNGRTPSLVDQMLTKGVMDDDQAGRLRTLVDAAVRAEDRFVDPSIALRLNLGDAESVPLWIDTVVAGLGSTASTQVGRSLGILQPGAAGPSLVVASGGARIARALLRKQSVNEGTHQALVHLLDNADDFRTFMRTVVDNTNERTVFQKVNAMLLAAGMEPFRDTFEEEMQQLEEDAALDAQFESELNGGGEEQEQPAPEEEQEPDFFDQLSGGQ